MKLLLQFCLLIFEGSYKNQLNSFLKESQDTALHKKLFIVGGGPSGIELACKIKDIFTDQFEINVIEKSNEILNKNKIFNREQAEKALEKRKIDWVKPIQKYKRGIL